LQSIPSGDLVVVALEHPTPWRPNALAIQRPRDPTPWRPNALHQAKSPPWGDPAVRPEEQKFKPATLSPTTNLGHTGLRSAARIPFNNNRPGVTLPSAWNRK